MSNVFFAAVIIPTAICLNRRRIRFIEGVLKVTLQKRTLRQLFICLRLPPLLGSCLGVGKQFCRFWTQSTYRVAMADFWRTFHRDGKSALAGEGGGFTPTPFHSIYVPSHTKVQWTVHSSWEGQKHSSYFISTLYSICSLWFWIWWLKECKSPAEYGLQHDSTSLHPPPPSTHSLPNAFTNAKGSTVKMPMSIVGVNFKRR
jgi:hypothetical protein